MKQISREQMHSALKDAWSQRSSTLWTAENPAAGQCGVTALVVNDHLGGDILKTRYRDLWHFYNRIDGEVIDFTDSQFDEMPVYTDEVSDRDEAFADTNAEQYDYLSGAVSRVLGER